MLSLVTSDVSVKVDSRSVVPYTTDVLLVLSLTVSYARDYKYEQERKLGKFFLVCL